MVDLASVDIVLATHEHPDHLDLKGLGDWLDLAPTLRVVVPQPIVELADDGMPPPTSPECSRGNTSP